MANQDKLKKIAEEFAMLDGICIRVNKLQVQPQKSVQNSYQVWRGYSAPKIIDSNEAARKYGGVIVMEGRRKYRV